MKGVAPEVQDGDLHGGLGGANSPITCPLFPNESARPYSRSIRCKLVGSSALTCILILHARNALASEKKTEACPDGRRRGCSAHSITAAVPSSLPSPLRMPSGLPPFRLSAFPAGRFLLSGRPALLWAGAGSGPFATSLGSAWGIGDPCGTFLRHALVPESLVLLLVLHARSLVWHLSPFFVQGLVWRRKPHQKPHQ